MGWTLDDTSWCTSVHDACLIASKLDRARDPMYPYRLHTTKLARTLRCKLPEGILALLTNTIQSTQHLFMLPSMHHQHEPMLVYRTLRLAPIDKVISHIQMQRLVAHIVDHFCNGDSALGFAPTHGLAEEAKGVGLNALGELLAVVAPEFFHFGVARPWTDGDLFIVSLGFRRMDDRWARGTHFDQPLGNISKTSPLQPAL